MRSAPVQFGSLNLERRAFDPGLTRHAVAMRSRDRSIQSLDEQLQLGQPA